MFNAFKDVSALMVGTVLSTLFGAITTILLARVFGPANYGNYQIILNIISVFIAVFSFGIDDAIFYFSSKEKEKSGIISAGLTLKIALSLVGFLVLIVISPLISNFYGIENLTFYLRFFGLEIIFYSIFMGFISGLNGLSMFKRSALLNISFNFLRIVIVVPLGIIFGLFGALLGRIIDWSLVFILGLVFLRKYVKPLLKKDLLKKIIFYGFPLYVSVFFSMLVNKFPMLFLGKFSSNDVGLFSAAFLVTSSLSTIIGSFVKVGVQRIASKEDITDKKEIYKKIKKYILIFSSFAVFMIIPFSSQVVNIIFGHDYGGSVIPLQIMMLGLFLSSIVSSESIYAYGSGKTKEIRDIVIGITIVTVISGILLIPRFHLIGAAITVFISKISGMILFMLFGIKNGLDFEIRPVLKTVLAGTVMAGTIFIITSLCGTLLSLFLGALMGPLSFLVAIYLLRLLDIKDFELVENILAFAKIDLKAVKVWSMLKDRNS